MKYIKPNFDEEWMEAQRYPEFEEMGYEGWLDIAQNGFYITNYKKIKDVLHNINLDYDSLEKDKRKRFEEAFKMGIIEIPIVIKFSDDDYDLLGGNTRLAGLIKNGINPKLWVVDLTEKKNDLTDLINMAHDDITRTKGKDYSPDVHELQKWIDMNLNETEKLKGGLSDNMSLGDIAVKHKVDIKDITNQFLQGVKVEMEHTNDKQKAKEIAMDHLYEDPKYYTKLKKVEAKEMTGADSAGAFSAPAFGQVIKKKYITKIHNMTEQEQEIDEVTDASSSGSYDVPLFGGTKGRKNPLSIGGPDTIYQGRAVKDKNFPKWGGPGGKFVKIKDKCKKFPYCNQGDINALELMETQEVREAIQETAKKYGLPTSHVENLVLNQFKQIFI